MKLRNIDIVNIHGALKEISFQPVAGKVKFELARLTQQVDTLASPIFDSIEGIPQTDPEVQEIFKIEQEVEFVTTIDAKVLEEMKISVSSIIALDCIINYEEESK